MKKLLLFTLILFITAVVCGCQNDTADAQEPIKQYDAENEIPIDGEEHGFLISEKTYKYEDGNVLILNAENMTDNAYTVVITAEFFDDNGESVKNLTKIFEGFPKGYKNYFVFSPETAFNSYKYEVETKPYDNETYANYLSARTVVKATSFPMGGDLDGNAYDKPRVSLLMNFPLECNYPEEESLIYSADFVVFDNEGEIFMIDSKLNAASITYSPEGNSISRTYIFPENIEWDGFKLPENLKGDLSCIVAFKKVTKE